MQRRLRCEGIAAALPLVLACLASISRAANLSATQEKRPRRRGRPGLTIVTGLGGSCSRAPAELLRAKGLFVPAVNGALDTPHPVSQALTYAIVNTFGGLSYEVDDLEDKVRFSVRASIQEQFHNFNCRTRACVFKEESFFPLLPFYRELVARRHHQKLCVVHCAREPIQWVLSHNWIGVFRWYEAFFMKGLPAKNSARWLTVNHSEVGTMYTLDERWIVYKSRLWSRFMNEVWAWFNATRHEPLVRNFWWRCRIDNLDSLVEAVAAECGAGADLPGPTPKSQNPWEVDRLLDSAKTFGGKGAADMDDPDVLRLVPLILQHTHETARRIGLALEDSDDIYQLFKVTLDVLTIVVNRMRVYKVSEVEMNQLWTALRRFGLF